MKIHTSLKAPAHVIWGIVASPVGKLAVGMTVKGQVCRVSFLKKETAAGTIHEWQREWPHTTFARGRMPKDAFQKPILMVGTDFQQSVWRIMAKIPAGSVTTYGGIAGYLGKPGAARAVGAACGANPVPYLVPCHRVVAANGGLGGFSGGLDMKKRLLALENFATHT